MWHHVRIWCSLFASSLSNYCGAPRVGRREHVQIMEGQVRGMTFLPLPPDKDMSDLGGGAGGGERLPNDAASDGGGGGGGKNPNQNNHSVLAGLPVGRGTMMSAHSPSGQKDRIHVLEGTLITWTKQIKAVLKQDPELILKVSIEE